MRERLIELLKTSPMIEALYAQNEERTLERTADHLLANGVIVPPCKVGDVVYRIYTQSGIGEDKVVGFMIYEMGICYIDDKGRETSCEKFGKTVFRTREEAEKALERSKG